MKKKLLFTLLAVVTIAGALYYGSKQELGVSQYSNYDTRVLTGSQVRAAVRQFANKPVAILISNELESMNTGAKIKTLDPDTMIGELTTTADGSIQFTDVSMDEVKDFVSPVRKFVASLIKNSEGEIIGIYFLDNFPGKNR